MKNCFIIRTGPPYYETVIDKVKEGIPKQQVFNVEIEELEILKDKLKYIPIFADYYIVSVNYKRKKELTNFLRWAKEFEYIKIIIYCTRSDNYSNMIAFCNQNDIDAFIYNSYKANKEEINSYIIKTIKSINPNASLTMNKVDTIRKRIRGYTMEVYGFLQKLAFTSISPKEIKDIIPKREILTAGTFGYNCYSDTAISKLDTVIYNYRFYPMVLVDSLNDYVEKVSKLYPYYVSGEFTDYNYNKFIAEKGNKFNILTDYQAQNYLSILKTTSYPKLILIKTIIGDCSKYNRTKTILNLYKLVRIIKS
jgi:hypothetical protein